MKLTFTVKPRIYTIKNASSPVEAANAAFNKISYLLSHTCGCYGKCHYSWVQKVFNSKDELIEYVEKGINIVNKELTQF